MRKKSLEEPLQKERLSLRGGPSPGEQLQAGLSHPCRLQTPAFSPSTASAGLGCVPPAPPSRRAGPAGKAPAALWCQHHRAAWGSIPESSVSGALLWNEDGAFKSATHRVSVGNEPPSKSVFVKTSEAQPSRRDGKAAVSRTLPRTESRGEPSSGTQNSTGTP